jgi:putative spermidine/putrescine transport system permease protein
MTDKSEQAKRILFLVPAVFTAAGISLFVMVNTFLEGLGFVPELSMYDIDLTTFLGLFKDRGFLEGLWLSFRVAFISTLLSTILGVLLAGTVCRSGSKILSLGARLPLILSYIAAGILVYNLVSDHGLIWHVLKLFGSDIGGLNVLYTDSAAGVIILYCFKGAPFVAISVLPVLTRVTDRFEGTAANLGATDLRTRFLVIFPLIRHSVAVAALVIFDYQMFTYESYHYLGASKPVALGVYAYNFGRLSDLKMRAAGMTVNSVMILIALVSLMLYMAAAGKEMKRDDEE